MAPKLEEEKPFEIEKKQKQQPPNISVSTIKLEDMKKHNSGLNGSPKLQRTLTNKAPSSARWNCLCSPTTHVGSFRCRFHRTNGMIRGGSVGSNLSELASKSTSIGDLV